MNRLSPQQLAEIRERHALVDDEPEYTIPGKWRTQVHQDRDSLLDHITALEADVKEADSYHNGEHLKDAHRINAMEAAIDGRDDLINDLRESGCLDQWNDDKVRKYYEGQQEQE